MLLISDLLYSTQRFMLKFERRPRGQVQSLSPGPEPGAGLDEVRFGLVTLRWVWMDGMNECGVCFFFYAFMICNSSLGACG